MGSHAPELLLADHLAVVFRSDDMAADVVIAPHPEPVIVELEDIERFIREAGIVEGLHAGSIQLVHRKLMSRSPIESRVTVAHGQAGAPTAPEVDITAPVTLPSPHELGGDLAVVANAVDGFGRVDEGDPVAVIRTREGVSTGRTVRGRPNSLIHTVGEYCNLGPDFAVEDAGDRVIVRARKSGWLFCRHPDISIQPLDIVTGHFREPADRERHLLVLGDLTRSIRVCGHVMVTGNILGATVETTGSVAVGGSIRSSRIVAAGDLVCRDARGSRLEIDGSVDVHGSLDLCTTASGGRVRVTRRIAGGSVVSGDTIRAHAIGSAERTPTDVEVCPRLVYRRRIRRLNHNINDARDRLERIRRATFRDAGTPRLDAARAEREAELAELVGQRERLKNASRRSLTATAIEVTGTLYAGVSVGLDDVHSESTARTHHIRILLGPGGGSLRFERNWD